METAYQQFQDLLRAEKERAEKAEAALASLKERLAAWKARDFGEVRTTASGVELSCRAIAPGLSLHDLTMAFHEGSKKAEPGDEFAGNPAKWPDTRGTFAVVEMLLASVDRFLSPQTSEKENT